MKKAYTFLFGLAAVAVVTMGLIWAALDNLGLDSKYDIVVGMWKQMAYFGAIFLGGLFTVLGILNFVGSQFNIKFKYDWPTIIYMMGTISFFGIFLLGITVGAGAVDIETSAKVLIVMFTFAIICWCIAFLLRGMVKESRESEYRIAKWRAERLGLPAPNPADYE